MIETPDRATRRRAARELPHERLNVAPEALTGKAAHWHVHTVAYSHERDGQQMDPIHLHNLVTNDLVLCETYVLKMVRPLSGAVRDKVLVEEATMCDDARHLDEAQRGLVSED